MGGTQKARRKQTYEREHACILHTERTQQRLETGPSHCEARSPTLSISLTSRVSSGSHKICLKRSNNSQEVHSSWYLPVTSIVGNKSYFTNQFMIDQTNIITAEGMTIGK